jgi:outer membrane immunogenic protein
MKKFILEGGLALTILSAGPAMSADVIVMPQRAVASGVFSWTSWYVGGFAGAAWTGNATTSDPCTTSSVCRLSVTGGETVSYPLSASAIGGVTAGYNYQIPGSAILFGVETEFGALRLNGSSSFAPVSSAAAAANLTASTTIGNWYNATTLRIGWTWDYVLFYAKGGFTLSTLESTISDARGLGPGEGKKDLFGYAWGGGVEYAFSNRWSVKAEYMYLGLNHSVGVCAGTSTSASFVGPGGTFCSTSSSQGVQTFKVGVNYLLDVGPVYDRY